MALQLRKAVIRSGLSSAVLALAIGLGSAWFSLGWNVGLIVALVLMALLLGSFSAWFKMRGMAQGIIDSIPVAMSFARVKRNQAVNGVRIDWQQFDDYAGQLKALGFVHLADVTSWPLARTVTGVAVIFCDSLTSTLVELQYIQLNQASQASQGSQGSQGSGANGMHFSIFSLLGGTIRITVSDHTLTAANYVMRSSADVVATYPAQNLIFLLDKHRRLVQTLRERTGKQATSGLTLARYVMLHRERFLWVRQHLIDLGAYKVMNEFDWFEAKPANHWAPPSAMLAALPIRNLDELDQLQASQTQSVMVDLPDSGAVSDSVAAAVSSSGADSVSAVGADNIYQPPAPIKPDQQGLQDLQDEAALRQKVSRAASWFYWIAALSLVNMGAQILNKEWSFALGLGLSQLLGREAHRLYESGAPGAAIFAMYLGCVGSIAFFAACGWFARKPSVFVFMVGMVFYALDTLIFLILLDGMGIAIHVVALFFLRQGVPAARVLRGG